MNTLLYKNFVSPTYCRDLVLQGIEVEIPFFWVVYEKAILHCHSFDRENYCKKHDRLMHSINPPQFIVPAFQIGDLDILLSHYYVSRGEAGFMMAVEDSLNLPTVHNIRLPDAYAVMVLQGLTTKLLDPVKCIQMINPQTISNENH